MPAVKKNAETWFARGLDAQELASGARTIAERQGHARDALDAFAAAASLGHADACVSIGIGYQYGVHGGVTARSDLAEHWLRLAANRDPGAMLAMGTFLLDRGRKAEARRWLRKALAQGDGGAACHLGREFEDKSPSRALRWYLKGVALGDPFAAVCAGRVLEALGSRREVQRAAEMYERAAREGFPDAQEDLARVRRKMSSLRSSH